MAGEKLTVTRDVGIPLREIRFRTSRSSGPGGQNVNRLETKVKLTFDTRSSIAFPAGVLARVLDALLREGWSEGIIRVVSQRHRSQWQNKQDALGKLAAILRKAMRPVKQRKPTAPTRSSRAVRSETKQKRSGVKKMRRNPIHDDE